MQKLLANIRIFFNNDEFKFEGDDTIQYLPSLSDWNIHTNYGHFVENRIAKLKEDLGYLIRGEYMPIEMTFKFDYVKGGKEIVTIHNEKQENIAKVLFAINESVHHNRSWTARIALKGRYAETTCYTYTMYDIIHQCAHGWNYDTFVKNVKEWAKSQNALNEEIKAAISAL